MAAGAFCEDWTRIHFLLHRIHGRKLLAEDYVVTPVFWLLYHKGAIQLFPFSFLRASIAITSFCMQLRKTAELLVNHQQALPCAVAFAVLEEESPLDCRFGERAHSLIQPINKALDE